MIVLLIGWLRERLFGKAVWPSKTPPKVCCRCFGIEGTGFDAFTVEELTGMTAHQRCEVDRRMFLVGLGYPQVFDQDAET